MIFLEYVEPNGMKLVETRKKKEQVLKSDGVL